MDIIDVKEINLDSVLADIREKSSEYEVVLSIVLSNGVGKTVFDDRPHEIVVGTSIDDPELEENIRKAIEETLDHRFVKDGGFSPEFEVTVVGTRRSSFTLGRNRSFNA